MAPATAAVREVAFTLMTSIFVSLSLCTIESLCFTGEISFNELSHINNTRISTHIQAVLPINILFIAEIVFHESKIIVKIKDYEITAHGRKWI
jgi:hypothetical protein